MALIKTPKQFSPDFSRPGVKPAGPVEIDWGNPLSKGLHFCVVLNEGAGQARDLVSGITSTSTGTPRRQADQFGRKVEFISTDALIFALPADMEIPSGAKISWFNSADVNADTNIRKRVMRLYNSVSGSAAGTDISNGAFNGIQSFIYDGAFDQTVSGGAYTAGTRFNIGGTADGTTLKCLVDGNVEDSILTGAIGRTIDTVILGNNTTTFPLNGHLYVSYVWTRALSDVEHYSLAQDPYQILKPATPQYYFTAAGAVGGLVVQSLSVGALLTLPSLAQHNALSTNNLSVSTSLTDPSLAQNNALLSDSLAVSTQLTEPTITQQNILVVDDLVSSTLLASQTLVQHNVLSVNDLSTATALTEPSLSIAGAISVANLSVSTQLTDAGLTQHNILIVDSLAVSTSLSNASLAGNIALSVNDLAVGTTITQPTLDAAFAILADNLTVGTSITEPSFDQHNVLLVDDISVDTLLSIVSFGGAVISCLSGYVTIQPVLSGDTTINPTLSGDVAID